MSYLAYRRRFLILLVPVVNFVFLVLFVFSPSSLPRLPKHLSRPRSPPPSPHGHETIEHISFGGKTSYQEHQQEDDNLTSTSNNITGDTNGSNFLIEQRQLVQSVHLKPLPDHLITTYKPGYLFASQSQSTATDNTEPREALDPTEKYLTFLPHSGFHNQRSELENALVLARLLNRTLIIPKVYLGPPMPWLSFSLLHSRLLYQTKTGLEHCRALIDDQFEDIEEILQTASAEAPVVNKLEEMNQPIPAKKIPPPDTQVADAPLVANSPVDAAPDKVNMPGSSVDDGGSQQLEKMPLKILDDQTMEQKELFDKERAWRDISVDTVPVITEQIVPNDPNADSDEGEEVDLDSEDDLQGDSEDDDDQEPSWIEEADEDDPYVIIATGDGAYGVVDLDGRHDLSGEEAQPEVEDWESVEDNEEGKSRDQIRVGIINGGPWEEEDEDDDDNEHNIPVRRPGSFVLPHQHHHHRSRRTRGRYLLQDKVDMDKASLPLYMPIDASLPEQNPRVWKRSLRKRSLNEEALAQTDHDLEKRQQHPFQQEQRQYQPPLPPQPTAKKLKPRHRKLLPSECLQYESWSMTDWDFFFDLNPLRRYVRIATKESVSMAYLESEFGIQLPKTEEPTSTFNATSSDNSSDSDSEDGDQDADDKDAAESDGPEEDDSEKEPPPLLRTEGDVLFFDDSSLYDYMFSENPDSPESAKIRSKYRQEFTIQWLNDRPEKLIHLGSIFGTGRVSIDSLQSKAWLIKIRDHLILNTDILQTTSQRIAEKISGSNHIGGVGQSATQTSHAGLVDAMDAGFVGIHIRMSDGHFSLSARNTIENIRQELMWQVGMSLDQDQGQGGVHDDMLGMEEHFEQHQETFNNKNPSEPEAGPFSAKKGRLSIEQCRSRALNHREQLFEPSSLSSSPPRRRSNGQYTPIYLATDAHRPRANPIFDKLFETFDCIFTLDDFAEDLEPLHQFRNPEDGALMAKFLIPMVDAMVVAKSAAFFGTPASTFSNYIQRQLRPAYTGLYD
ncbi:hypothetical protein CPC16_009867 [Podila verticillata]|nr:hypothetical protein CPC16_009867 [Podila verticillata]